MTTGANELELLINHLVANRPRGEGDGRVVGLMDDGQPASLRRLLDVLAHHAGASFDSTLLQINASTVGPASELDGIVGREGDLELERALVIGSEDSARFLIAGWDDGASACKMYAYTPEGAGVTTQFQGLVTGISIFLNDAVNRHDDLFEMDPDEAGDALLEMADDNPALKDLFFADVELGDDDF